MGSGPLDENRHTFSDPESIAVLPDRTSLIGFEDNARIWQYAGSSAGGAPVKELVGNEELRACPPNEGVETMVLLRSSPTSGDGLFLVMCEGLRADVEVGRRTAVPLYLYALPAARAPRAARARLERVFWYPIVDGLLPSAAVLHPATDRLLVLERVHVRDAGVVSRIRQLRPPAAALVGGQMPNGSVLAADLLAELCPDEDRDAVDNFEGLALDAHGARLWLVSDDNFQHGDQRTLLHELALPLTLPAERWPASVPSREPCRALRQPHDYWTGQTQLRSEAAIARNATSISPVLIAAGVLLLMMMMTAMVLGRALTRGAHHSLRAARSCANAQKASSSSGSCGWLRRGRGVSII